MPLSVCIITQCIQAIGIRPHAIIVRESERLSCYLPGKSDDYKAITKQGIGDDEPLTFPAEGGNFPEKCVRETLKRIHTSDSTINITFLDQGISWQHTQLLDRWATQSEKQNSTRKQDLAIRIFHVAEDERLNEVATGTLPATYKGQPVQPKPQSVLRSSISLNLAIIAPSQPLQIGDLKTIPAEFARFIWKSSRAPSRNEQPSDKAWNYLHHSERSLTTVEIAKGIYKDPTVTDIVSTYKALRSGERKSYLVVPMIGFRDSILVAKEYLGEYSKLTFIDITSDELRGLYFQRYSNRAPRNENSENIHIGKSVTRCLKVTSNGLRLLDLTEDVIYGLTGKIGVILSLADVCRVRDALQHNSGTVIE